MYKFSSCVGKKVKIIVSHATISRLQPYRSMQIVNSIRHTAAHTEGLSLILQIMVFVPWYQLSLMHVKTLIPITLHLKPNLSTQC